MRTLKFIVDRLSIKKDPNCDFSGLVPGTEEYLKAEFTFSSEWNGCDKVVGFFSPLGREYPPRYLADGYSCVIPAEALARRKFKIQIIGGNGETRLTTNKLEVVQGGGNV